MNYYEILGLETDCSKADIKIAYRKLVHEFHPDVNPSGAKKFKEISKAYDTLSNDEKRKHYDILNGIFKPVKEKQEHNTLDDNTEEYSAKNDKKHSNTQEKTPCKNDGRFLSEMFKHIFDKPKYDKVLPIDGEDINADVAVSLSDVLHGVSKTVNIVNMELCPRCKGRKFVNGTKCQVCNGMGQYSQHKKLTVKIPVNMKNGGKLRIKGEGNKGHFGGKNGDLYLQVNIEGNSRVQYDGENIIYNIPITPYEAVLGGEIIIPTFDGFLKLQLPKNTASGQKFRLAGQGVKKGNGKGDLIVIVSIEISKHLSDEEVKLYEKLKKIATDDIRENLLND